jgi:mannose-6-phosphate isomerase-like protein (cupin superfamily)
MLKVLPFVVAFGLGAAVSTGVLRMKSADAAEAKPGFLVKHDSEVMRKEPGPHEGTGETTAYRYFDSLADAKVIFRKRALHPGASIGMHKLTHDEVYYVVSGRGELNVDGAKREMTPGTAAFMYERTSVGIRQLGKEDLVIIVVYPPPVESASTKR